MKSHSAEAGLGRCRPCAVPNLSWSGAHPDAIRMATQIRIEDVAHALANLCWLALPSKVFYSVAQHNYLASLIVPPPQAYGALLMNVGETLEQSLPECFDADGQSGAELLARFGAPASPPLAVRCADLVLRATEERDFGPLSSHAPHHLGDIRPLALRIEPLPPIVAKHLFLDRFYELRPGRCADRVPRADPLRRAAR